MVIEYVIHGEQFDYIVQNYDHRCWFGFLFLVQLKNKEKIQDIVMQRRQNHIIQTQWYEAQRQQIIASYVTSLCSCFLYKYWYIPS